MDSQTPSPSSSSSSSRSADTINAYSPHFETELRRRRVFFLRGRTDHNPTDINDFKSFVSRERGSPEPTEEDVQRIRVKADRSRNEAAVVQSILPELLPVDNLYTSDDFETIPNQQWDKRVSLPVPALSRSVADDNGSPSRKRKAPGGSPRTTRGTRLAVPKPDQAIGISSESLTCYNAREHLGHVCTPVAADSDLLFPFFTAECKGDQGRLKVSRMQNAHNAAVMLHNMRRLHCAASVDTFGVREESVDPFVGDESYGSTLEAEDMHNHVDKDDDHDAPEKDTFYNHIHAVTLSLSTESIELCYHWASPSENTMKRQKRTSTAINNNADINICTRPLNTWSLSSESHNDYVMARRCVRNALDWCRDRTAGWVRRKMRGLEDRLCRKRQLEEESQPVPQPERQKRARTERSSSRTSDRAMYGSCMSSKKNAILGAGLKARTKPRLKVKPCLQNQSTQQHDSPPTQLRRSGSGLKVELDMRSSDDDDDDDDDDVDDDIAVDDRRGAVDGSTQHTSLTGLMTPSETLCFPSMIAGDSNNCNLNEVVDDESTSTSPFNIAKASEHDQYQLQACGIHNKPLSMYDHDRPRHYRKQQQQRNRFIAEKRPDLRDYTFSSSSSSSSPSFLPGNNNNNNNNNTLSPNSSPLLPLSLSLSPLHS